MSAVYFGGSRFQSHPSVPAVVAAVVAAGQSVHVGCQRGVDQQVIASMPFKFYSSLFVFAVAPKSSASQFVASAFGLGAQVRFSAGGSSAPMPARFLLRSIAAFQGCESAVFFQPGPGSLAVARECVKSGLPVFAFQEQAPAPIPSCRGQWCMSFFRGFQCWQWGRLPEPQEKQLSFI